MEVIKPIKTTQIKSSDLKDFFSGSEARARGRLAIRPLSRANKRNKSSNHTTTMSTPSPKAAKSSSRYSIGMFSAGEARCDRWQELAHAAQTLVAQASSGSSTKETLAAVETLLAPLSVIETFRAYPGEVMMSALKDALGRRDYSSFSRITNRIAKAIITGSYRRSASAWKLGEEGDTEGSDRLLKDYFETGDLTKPYFEVLIVDRKSVVEGR